MSTSTENLSTASLEGLYKAAEKLLDQADLSVIQRKEQLAVAETAQWAALKEAAKWGAALTQRKGPGRREAAA